MNRNFYGNWLEEDYSYGLYSGWHYSSIFRGSYAASEPEVQAIQNIIITLKPKVIFSYNALASVTEDEMLMSRLSKKDEAYYRKARAFGEIYSKTYRSQPNSGLSHEKIPIFYHASPGSLPSFAYEKGIPCFDLEYARSDLLKPCVNDFTTGEMVEACSQRHQRALLAVLEYLAK